MKKFNILTVAALSMVISLLSGCTGGKDEPQPVDPPEPEIPNVFEEASYEDYMAALEGKSFTDATYEKCLINGTVEDYVESEVLARFENEPIRFIGDITRPTNRPQKDYEVAEYAMSFVMSFATNWSNDEDVKFYLNKGNQETPYKVEAMEFVSAEAEAKSTYIYNSVGMLTSVNSVIVNAPVDPLINYALDIKPVKDLTFTWLDKDTIDSYTRVSFTAFHEKAEAFEGAECSYQSGHVNGTIGYSNSETVNTLTNELVVRGGSDRFESINYTSEIANLYHNTASMITDTDRNYFYYSESLDSLMAIRYFVADLEDIIERTLVWNNNGLPTMAKDNTFGDISLFGSSPIYDLSFGYSNDIATVTLTILSGVGAWADGATQKVITANVGSYLGNALSGFDMPACEGMTTYGSSLVRENGRLIRYSERIYDDMTLTIPFYNNEGSPTILKFAAPSSIRFTMQGFDSNKPMLAYLTDGSNDGFYFTSGAKQTLDYTFRETKAPVSTKTIYFYGADVALGDENGLFIPKNSSLVSLTLNGNSTIANYAYTKTNLTDVTVNAAGIETIGAHAFENCEDLEKLYCGYIHNIGAYAFANTGLTGVFTAAKSATTIGEKAFDSCESLNGVLVNSTLTYNDASSITPDGKINYFRRDQSVPEGWNTNWNGDAKVLYELTDDSFYHEETATDVGGYVGGSTGEETFTFAMFLTHDKTYTIHVFALADDDITVSLIDGTEVVKAIHGGSGNYDKTVTGVSGGQWIIIEVCGLESLNSNGYFFRVTQEA